ncbi:MAG TPA: hypothetical protein VF444_12905 [Pseudonocardiaceae bacterium]
MTKGLHRLAGLLALLLIVLFFVSSIVVELVGDHHAVATLKTSILVGVCVLVPTMVTTALTGRARARGRRGPVVAAKQRRTVIIAAIGLAVLVPCAVTLWRLSSSGDFSTAFFAVQAVELAAGATNIILLSLNVRTGLIMTGRLRKRPRSGRARGQIGVATQRAGVPDGADVDTTP